jgi:glutathione S-transferase
LKERGNKKLAYLEKTLLGGNKHYLVGEKLSVADIYLYIVLSWIQYLGGALDLSAYPKVKAFFERVGALDGVKAAHARIATNPATTI